MAAQHWADHVWLIKCGRCETVFTGTHGATRQQTWRRAERLGWQRRYFGKHFGTICPSCIEDVGRSGAKQRF